MVILCVFSDLPIISSKFCSVSLGNEVILYPCQLPALRAVMTGRAPLVTPGRYPARFLPLIHLLFLVVHTGPQSASMPRYRAGGADCLADMGGS